MQRKTRLPRKDLFGYRKHSVVTAEVFLKYRLEVTRRIVE